MVWRAFYARRLFLAGTRGSGAAVEDVRFVRDEQANHAWAIEHAAEAADGRPWLGHERSVAQSASEPPVVLSRRVYVVVVTGVVMWGAVRRWVAPRAIDGPASPDRSPSIGP
jgi:hypothetical protein